MWISLAIRFPNKLVPAVLSWGKVRTPIPKMVCTTNMSPNHDTQFRTVKEAKLIMWMNK